MDFIFKISSAEGLELQERVSERLKSLEKSNKRLKDEYAKLASIPSKAFDPQVLVDPVPSKNLYHQQERAREEKQMAVDEMRCVLKYYSKIVEMADIAIQESVLASDIYQAYFLISYREMNRRILIEWRSIFAGFLQP